ncbi:class I SAM-dependent methyltransferase [Spirosoma endophyticum]|uniref:Methyltransferase domain-containing protein n=1 Tax=Spirosoma endophyticum TaxID=662367 RepID=A0A1I2BE67_9BACT|nr:class I SAM-dependent methyltransferase [Spirosoma endophyticum]SFE54257.1 Methyltransferase domain-containing protein [Spirosoma endophyticum]
MDRLELIQLLISQKKLRNYLEIGVENGHIFFRLKSPFKVSVDPKFIFDTMRKVGKTILNPYNLTNQYFEKTSDAFFEQDADRVFTSTKLQLALVDGMHEYQYALRDVENTLRYLNDEGVIIMHDCNPQSEQAAGRFEDWQEGVWNGDVWRTVVHLRSQRPDLNVFVLDTDHGLGIVTKRKPSEGPNPNVLDFSPAQIQSMSYQEFDRSRINLLNLKPASYAYEYFSLQPSSLK